MLILPFDKIQKNVQQTLVRLVVANAAKAAVANKKLVVDTTTSRLASTTNSHTKNLTANLDFAIKGEWAKKS